MSFTRNIGLRGPAAARRTQRNLDARQAHVDAAPRAYEFDLKDGSNNPGLPADATLSERQSALLRRQLGEFDNLGYADLEKRAFNEGKKRSLGELIGEMQTFDKVSGYDTSRDLASTARSLSSRTGAIEDPAANLRRRSSLATAANQAQGRNLGLRGLLDRQTTARQSSLGAATAMEGVAADTLGTLANADANKKLMNAQAKAGKSGSGLQTALSLAGTAASIYAAFGSSHSFKENKEPVTILDKLSDVPVERWNYIDDPNSHIGPYAEDFNGTFGLSGGKYIQLIDYLGVLLGAVKELNEKVERLSDELLQQ